MSNADRKCDSLSEEETITFLTFIAQNIHLIRYKLDSTVGNTRRRNA